MMGIQCDVTIDGYTDVTKELKKKEFENLDTYFT